MKRLAQAELGHQPQRKATSQTRRSVTAAAAASPAASAPVCSAHTSCTSAASLQLTRSQASIPPLSALERVSSDVLVLILQCLSARHKLTAISRLSRAFHPLPARAFSRDSICPLLPSGWSLQTRSKEPLWLHLKSVLPFLVISDAGTGHALDFLHLTVEQAEQPGISTLFTCPRSLRSLPHSAELKELSLWLKLPADADCTATLRCLLHSALSLPSLEQLTIHHWLERAEPLETLTMDYGSRRDEHRQLDWTDAALPHAASLRHLTLTRLSLSAASIFRLCCLPLLSLELNGCRVLDGGDGAVISAEQAEGSGSDRSALKSLWLPDGDDNVGALQLYLRATQHSSNARIERLRCSGPPSQALLSLIVSHAQLQQLRRLDLERCYVDLSCGPALDLSPLMTASGLPRLPHLTQLRFPVSCIRTDLYDRCDPKLERVFVSSSQQLVAAYCEQLTSLTVSVQSASTLSAWLRLLFACCRHLEALSVKSHETLTREPPVELQLEAEPAADVMTMSLTRLRKLRLAWLPLSDGGLLSLLCRCPELEVCVLSELPHVTVVGKEAALHRCPRLMSEAEWDDNW